MQPSKHGRKQTHGRNDTFLGVLFSFYSFSTGLKKATLLLPTCSISGLEASLLHWVVWEKTQEHLVAAGHDRGGFFGATEASESWDAHVSPVVDLQMVVSTLQMSLHVDLVENLRAIWKNSWLLYHEIMFQKKKKWHTSLMRWPGVVVRIQVQAFLLGYLSGQLGLLIFPETLLTTWSQPAEKHNSRAD